MIGEKQYTKLSKFMSRVLRHAPETINLSLDSNGWANVDELIEKMTQNGNNIDRTTPEKLLPVKKWQMQGIDFTNLKMVCGWLMKYRLSLLLQIKLSN